MRFFSLLTIPLLSYTALANPVLNSETAELALRDNGDLTARTWFDHDYRCYDILAKLKCKLKGDQWACDSKCKCVETPRECDTYCPYESTKKKACEQKYGYKWNAHECRCDCVCADAEKKKDKCDKDMGHFNLDKCQCEGARCPDSEEKEKMCKKKMGMFSKHECACTCDKKMKEACKGTFSDHECTCTCDPHHRDSCKAAGGKYDDKTCVCTPKTCNKKEKEACKGTFSDHECTCTCDPHHKQTCEHEGGKYDDKNCVCKPKKEKENEGCKDSHLINLCKLKGKGCGEYNSSYFLSSLVDTG